MLPLSPAHGRRYDPTADPNYSAVVLLLHGNGSNGGTVFTDNSPNAFTDSAHNSVVTTTAIKKFGSASIDLRNSGAYNTAIQWPTGTETAINAIGTGDFTCEGWAYLDTAGAADIFCSRDNSASGMYVGLSTLSKLQFGNVSSKLTANTAFTVGVWTHFAVVRASGVISMYKDAVSDFTPSSSGPASMSITSSSQPVVGYAVATGAGKSAALVDDFRLTALVARSIVLPTGEYPNH